MAVLIFIAFQVILFAIGLIGPWRDPPERSTNGRLPRPVRILLSLSLLAAVSVIWASGARSPAYAQWVLWGMFASFVGDLIMARLIPLPNRLIGGMAAFAVAHACYITAYLVTINRASFTLSLDRLVTGLSFGVGLYGVISVLGWLLVIRNPEKSRSVNVGALLYGMWIGVMASFALALAYTLGGAFWLTAFGGLAFVASDFIIGVTEIRGLSLKNANDWVWLTYVIGQMGILYAAAL
ncbi:MAG: lysoplasmalogenase [Chloroflexi bacterium]|nr:lysoplasmalogenase [Chloroflexota bacterium]